MWVIYPNTEQVHIYTATDRVTIVDTAATLTAESLFPGLAIPVAALFVIED